MPRLTKRQKLLSAAARKGWETRKRNEAEKQARIEAAVQEALRLERAAKRIAKKRDAERATAAQEQTAKRKAAAAKGAATKAAKHVLEGVPIKRADRVESLEQWNKLGYANWAAGQPQQFHIGGIVATRGKESINAAQLKVEFHGTINAPPGVEFTSGFLDQVREQWTRTGRAPDGIKMQQVSWTRNNKMVATHGPAALQDARRDMLARFPHALTTTKLQ